MYLAPAKREPCIWVIQPHRNDGNQWQITSETEYGMTRSSAIRKVRTYKHHYVVATESGSLYKLYKDREMTNAQYTLEDIKHEFN